VLNKNLSRNSLLGLRKLGSSGLLVEKLTNSKGSQSLHQTSTVVGSGRIGKTEHSLCNLSIELRVAVSNVRFNVNKLLNVVKVSIHLENGNVSSKVLLLSVGQLDSGGGGRKLFGRGSPFDFRSLVKEVGGGEVRNSLLLDGTDLKGLLVLGVEVGGEDLNNVVGVLLLGLDVGIEIGLTGLNGSHDRLKRVTTLLHITLDLPVELDIGRDIKVKGEVDEFADTVINEGVKSLNNDNGGGFNLLGSIKSSIDVVVDGLHDSLSLLKSLNVLVHKVELLLSGVKSSKTRDLTSITVVKMVVIKADNGGNIRNESVGFPSSVAESATEGSAHLSSEGGGHTTHEGGLSATGIGSETDDNGCLAGFKGHLESTAATKVGGHECGGEGRGGCDRKGSDGDRKLHG
jgi:hypothetical protein